MTSSTRGTRITSEADAPMGTRVESTDGHTGTVLGHLRGSVKVEWDNGGTHAAPLSHGGLWTHVERTYSVQYSDERGNTSERTYTDASEAVAAFLDMTGGEYAGFPEPDAWDLIGHVSEATAQHGYTEALPYSEATGHVTVSVSYMRDDAPDALRWHTVSTGGNCTADVHLMHGTHVAVSTTDGVGLYTVDGWDGSTADEDDGQPLVWVEGAADRNALAARWARMLATTPDLAGAVQAVREDMAQDGATDVEPYLNPDGLAMYGVSVEAVRDAMTGR